MATDLTGMIPHGWSGGESVTKWWKGNHLHLYRLRKNCAQCNAEMTIDVTKAAIMGTAKNAGLHLTRCPKCRAESKGGLGSRGGTSRPTVEGQAPASDALTDTEFLEAELTGVYKQIDAVRAENAALKERLAKYELAPAIAAVAKPIKPYEPPLTMAESTARLNAAAKEKMPWT